MESGDRSLVVLVHVAVLTRAGMMAVSRMSVMLKMPFGWRCQRVCVPFQILVMNACRRSGGWEQSAVQIEAVSKVARGLDLGTQI